MKTSDVLKKVPLAVDGEVLSHEGAAGIGGLLNVAADVMANEDWINADLIVAIRTRRDPLTGETSFRTFNLLAGEALPETGA